MTNYNNDRRFTWKAMLLIVAVVIAIASLWYTNTLVAKIADEEEHKVQLWAEATKQLASSNNTSKDISFLFRVIKDNETVPSLLLNDKKELISFKNMDSLLINSPEKLAGQIKKMEVKHKPIVFTIFGGTKNYVYYKDSAILTQLRYYPYVQLGIIFLFILVSYLAFNAARKSEQDQVWVGLARETAHQLGTPISSLMAWVEYLKLKNEDDDASREIEKDVKRLETVADRFSKIGSAPKLDPENIVDALQRSINYMKKRTSSKVEFTFTYPVHGVMVNMNTSLFQWVIENLFANAIDAMKGSGSMNVNVFVDENEWAIIDITDSGHGIKRKNLKTVFEPGFTTKKTGWGLGLSLVKRIMESYHSGKIYVHKTEVGVGTTFRIELKRV